MSDYMFPQDIVPGEARWSSIDSTAAFAADTTGAIRTSEIMGGNALNPTFVWPPMKNEVATGRQRSRVISVMRRLRGQANRIWLQVPGYSPQGSFPASELVSNPAYANGSTGYATGSFALTSQDRVLRATRVENLNTVSSVIRLSAALTVTQYMPHVLRVMCAAGRGSFADLSLRAGNTDNGIEYGQSGTLSSGLLTFGFVPYDTTCRAGLYQGANTLSLAGDYLESQMFSISRCALVDNGPNLLLRSDEFDNAVWSNGRSTDAANSTAAPDATTTADSIIEDATASNTHYISQDATVAAAVRDYAFTVALKAGTRTFAQIAMVESTSSHQCVVDVNLTTGALGTPTVDGANWANPRAFSRSLGNGWFAVTIVGRKVSAGTTLTARIYLASALGTISYSGDGASLIYAWRATLAQSSVPTRLVQSTTAAVAATPQSGVGLHVKGLPASTDGLLEQGDIDQTGRELHWLAARQNSNAAGLGFLQLVNPLRNAPADNDPVIFSNPMGKFLQERNIFEWKDMPGLFSDFEIGFLEATAG